MFKKLTALFLACTLALSMTTGAFAAEISTTTDGTLPSGTVVTGDGTSMEIPAASITEFTLPTGSAFDFYFDPQGLTTIEVGSSADLSTLNGGLIVMKSKFAPEFINKSGFDVEATVNVALVAGSNGLVLKSTTTDLATASDPNALFYVQPSVTNVKRVASTSSDYTATEKGIVLNTTTSTDLKFALPAADYKITRTSDTDFTASLTDDSVNGSALKFGGFVNSNASYASITDASIKVTFTVVAKDLPDGTPSDFYETATGTNAFGLLKVPNISLVDPASSGANGPLTAGFQSSTANAVGITGWTRTSATAATANATLATFATGVKIPFYVDNATGITATVGVGGSDLSPVYDAVNKTLTLTRSFAGGGLKEILINVGGKTYTVNITVS